MKNEQHCTTCGLVNPCKCRCHRIKWITVGWDGIIFRIPKEYNSEIVKEWEILENEARRQQKLETLEYVKDAFCKMKDEELYNWLKKEIKKATK